MHEKIKQHKVNDIQKKKTWYKIGIAMRYHFSSIKQYETKMDKKKKTYHSNVWIVTEA